MARLPPGRHGLAKDFVVDNQRSRLAAGLIALVAEKGYEAVTVSDVCKASGVSRRTFYKYFNSREECFLDVLGRISDHLLSEAQERAQEQTQWPDRLRAELEVVVETLSANPDLARCLQEASSLGGEVGIRYRAGLKAAYRQGAEGSPSELDEVGQIALMNGLAALSFRGIVSDGKRAAPKTLEDLQEFVRIQFSSA